MSWNFSYSILIIWGKNNLPIDIHISSAFTCTLKQLNQESQNCSIWTKCEPLLLFIKFYWNTDTLIHLCYCLYLLSCYSDRAAQCDSTVYLTKSKILQYLSLYKSNLPDSLLKHIFLNAQCLLASLLVCVLKI